MLRDTLAALLTPLVEGLGYELWELEYAPGRGNSVLRLYIDAAAGIAIEDCERVSRAVSEVLDAEDPIPGQYTLEVSSPGLDRPLRTAAQFARYVGERVYVETAQAIEGRRRFKGALTAVDAATLEVEVDGKRWTLPISGIRKAHLAPDV
ncbi:MAG: ribosome maturation factor RimP [Steroidobacteraceae bacterium]|nr:ribosome maturation factor RimP [Steroidobacteraceae bacterium]